MTALISATQVSRISSGRVVHSFMNCRGAPAAITVTDEACGGEPRSSASGRHGVFSSSSATQ